MPSPAEFAEKPNASRPFPPELIYFTAMRHVILGALRRLLLSPQVPSVLRPSQGLFRMQTETKPKSAKCPMLSELQDGALEHVILAQRPQLPSPVCTRKLGHATRMQKLGTPGPRGPIQLLKARRQRG